MTGDCEGCGAPMTARECEYCKRVSAPAQTPFSSMLGAAMGGTYQIYTPVDWRDVYGNPAYGGSHELP